MLGPGHGLLIQCLDVGTTELVEAQVTLQSRREERGLLGVERILWDGASGQGWGQAESGLVLLQVQVTQADGQTGCVGLTPQRGRAPDRGEGARADTVWRDDFTFCKKTVK